jgi:protein-tyrosine phosphatase
VVSALTPAEIADFGLLEEARLVEGAGLMYLSFPMPDRGIPEDHRQALSLLHRLEELLAAGKNVGVHCRQGIGRSALLAGGLLVLGGVKPEAAIERVNQSRGVPVPETPEQRRWIASVANELVHKP